jgi:carboxylesterase type B
MACSYVRLFQLAVFSLACAVGSHSARTAAAAGGDGGGDGGGARKAAPGSQSDPVVPIPGLGSVRGVANGLAVEFRGLPYAAPAVRWAAPAPPAPWSGVRDATADGPGCIQNCSEPAGVCPARVSEDCLLLNVFVPAGAAGGPLPVIVFFHGGAFRDGFAGGPLYNGSALAAGAARAIVVAASYRLGAFGFLFGSGETPMPDDPAGNFGILDQRAALQWVRAHIAAFGGDAARVTVWGQSAGAMSVATHLISPGSRGLFAAAVLDSEPLALPFRTPASARALAAALAAAAGCDARAQRTQSPAACLRALPAAALLSAQTQAAKNVSDDLPYAVLQLFVPFTPTTGTADVPNAPLASFQGLPGAVPVADVPVAVTTVGSEGTIFIYEGFTAPVSALEYAAALAVVFGPGAALRIGTQYPAPAGAADLRPLTANVTTAALFRCAARNATRSLAAAPGRRAPVFLGEWTKLISWAPALWTNATPAFRACWTQVCHAQELPYLFFPQLANRTDWQPDDAALSSAGRSYLAAFAASAGSAMGDGASNGAPPLAWPPVDAAGAAPRMVFDGPARRVDFNDDECKLWDEIGYVYY